MGRLHTRYSPVRRSSPFDCSKSLPLDLHVLGLPLAFILSQDQTLHCKSLLILLKVYFFLIKKLTKTRFSNLPIPLKSFKELPTQFKLQKMSKFYWGCKDKTNFISLQTFFENFKLIFSKSGCKDIYIDFILPNILCIFFYF